LGAKQQEHRGLFQHKPCIHNDLNVPERLEQPKTLIPIPAHTHSPIMKTETNTHPTQHDPTGVRHPDGSDGYSLFLFLRGQIHHLSHLPPELLYETNPK
jgi:hypothetical protein